MDHWQSDRVTLPLNNSLKSSAALQISEYFMNQYSQKQQLFIRLNADTVKISKTIERTGPQLLVTFSAAYKDLSGKEGFPMLPLHAQARQIASSLLATNIINYIQTI